MVNTTEIYRDSTLLRKSSPLHEKGFLDVPRLSSIRTTNERGQLTDTTFDYDPASGSRYNAPTDVRVYLGNEFTGQLLRRIHTEYLNDINYEGSLQNSGTLWWKPGGGLSGGPYWQGSHIFNLVSVSEVYAGDNVTRLSRTEYQYDGGSLIDAPGIIQHNITYNPHTPPQEVCDNVPDMTDPDCMSPGCEAYWSACDGICPNIPNCYFVPLYDSRTGYRGNVTQIKSYADAASLDQATAVVTTLTYDIAGNVRAQSSSCCEQTTITCTGATQYAWPELMTSGSPSDPNKQNSSSATYDYNTGLVLTSKDANDRPSQVVYDSNTLRPIDEYLSTGAYLHYIYDDLNLSVSDFVYELGQSGGNFASRSDKYIDGLGRVIKAVAFGKDYVQDVVEVKFDKLGRVSQQSRPYRSGVEIPLWSTVTYDSLDRPIQTVSPDGSVVTKAYNQSPDPPGASGQPGETVKVTDSWGRQRWARSDLFGRLVEVAEPNPGGDGTLSSGALFTTYLYDSLDRLIQVNQGAQMRRFRYDALGRLTHQKLAERDATLNDGGFYVGNGVWSDVFEYDTRSNLKMRVDARGVRSYFNYDNDPLNRLQSVQHNKDLAPPHLAGDIPGSYGVPSPNINAVYSYMPSGDKRRVRTVGLDGGNGNQTIDYDIEGRVSQVYQTFGGRESYPLETDYIWDTLSRVKEIHYPKQYGAGDARKIVKHNYDIASRIDSLQFDGVTMASNPVYNASSQTTSLAVGNEITENYNFDPKTGLLLSQQVNKGAEQLVNLQYNYTESHDLGNNGPKTGQLTSLTDLKNQARNRAYEYDKLGRLIKVKGGVNAVSAPAWEQVYSYDRYGNKGTPGSGGGSEPQVWFDDAPPAGASVNSYVKPTAIIALRSFNGYYVTEELTDPDPNRRVNATSAAIGPREKFYIIDVNGGHLESGDQIEIRTADGGERSIFAQGGGEAYPGGRLYTSLTPPPTWRDLIIRKTDGSSGIIYHDTEISLQSTNGYYVSADGGGAPAGSPAPAGQMSASRTAVLAWEKFRMILVSGSTTAGPDEAWEWPESNPFPYSGLKSHKSKGRSGLHQHYFSGATQTLQLNAGDKLFTYVYLDPNNMPSEIMLQWSENSSWEHRAYWGANNIDLGTNGTESRRHMGPLPQAGGWVRLEVPASVVGLEAKTLNGMAFTIFDGQAWWDKTGKTSDLIGMSGPGVGGDSNRIFSTDDPFADLGLNKGYGSITANYSDSDNTGTPRRGGPRVSSEEYGKALSANGVGGASLAKYPAGAQPTTPRKEYGYRGGLLRSPAAAQSGSVVTVYPGAHQTPATPGHSAVNPPLNAGHAATNVVASHFDGAAGKSGRWFAFQPVSGLITKISLKFTWSTQGTVNTDIPSTPEPSGHNASAQASFNIYYSINNGSNFTNAISRSESSYIAEPGGDGGGFYDSGSFSVDLPANTPIDQIIVSDSLDVFAWANGEGQSSGAVDATISDIRLEVEIDTPPVISNVAAGGITASSATITWNTNENSDSQVEYRISAGSWQSTTLNTLPVTAHSQGLSGLTPATIYYYRVKSKDVSGNLATSAEFPFTTLGSNDATFVTQSVPATMTGGEAYTVTVSMRNQGTTTWTTGQSYSLGSQNPENTTIWGTGRAPLPSASISPGVTATFSFVVTAPSSPGSYNFQWRMVQDGVEWFGATTPNIAVQVVPGLDTTPPTGASISPAAGAANVNVNTNVTITFSEAMDAATLNGATVELRNPSNALVSSTVSYDPASFTATLDPTAALASGTTYTARVRGGGADPRVKDLAGNALAADLTWTFTTTQSVATSLDGLANLLYDTTNNRITTPGFEYDPAGNQTRAVIEASGAQQQYRYDCAGRLARVLDSGGAELARYVYGEGRERLMSVEGGVTKFFALAGGQIIAEYEAWGTNGLIWKTSYIYLGGKLLATTSGVDETGTRFHHPDRLGTRLTTNAAGTVVTEQWTMPFGNMQPFTTVPGGENPYQHPTLSNPSKKRFTSYDRSDATGLDYAMNRFYSPQQGRFTQVDPIGMSASSLGNPQSLNLYAYCGNDPINRIDPAGQSWEAIGSFFKAIGGAIASFFSIGFGPGFRTPTTFPGGQGGFRTPPFINSFSGGTDDIEDIGLVLSIPTRAPGPWWDKIKELGSAAWEWFLTDGLHHIADFSSGFADTITLGGTKKIRQWMGTDDKVDPCSKMYMGGQVAGTAHALAMGGGAAYSGARAMGGVKGGASLGARRFFHDPRKFSTVSRQYWGARGGANGRHLHHWAIPRRSGGPNAGWNLLELPGGFNSWMNGTTFTRQAAEWGVRAAIPGSVAAGAAQGAQWGVEREAWKSQSGC